MRQSRVSSAYLPVFCQELHQMVKAGIPVGEGLALLKEDESDRAVLQWLDALCQYADEGMPLSAALRETGAFPAYMTDMLSLAERTGSLEDTLLSLSAHYERQNRMTADLRQALITPLALLVVMLAVVGLLVTQVLPIFDRVFAQLGVEMSAMGLALMEAGSVLSSAGTGIALILAALVVCALAVALIPALRLAFSRWFRRQLGGRGILGAVDSARFASAMAMASASGLSMEESVDLAAQVCGGAKRTDARVAVCRAAMDEGTRTGEALAQCGLFSARDGRLLMLAERTGSLSDALERLARRSEEEALRRIDGAVSAVEPAIVILTAALAGVILLSVMLPLMSILSTIG